MAGVSGVRQNIDKRKLRGVVDDSPRLNLLLEHKADELKRRARTVFLSRQITSNDFRTSETSPPRYIASFRKRKVKLIKGYKWQVINVDPGAGWVELGAHAGGKTLVLRYFPLKTALASMGATN